MRFDRALGHIQVAGNFPVITSLEQKIDDLPLPGTDVVEILVHNNLHPTTPQPHPRH
ncbi:MAG: hypothetical protein WBY61_21365 [Terriglobales bacterium]